MVLTSLELKEMFAEYLFHSYLYYKRHISLIQDEEFDEICKTLLDNWDNFEHRFKTLITIEDLQAGTGYAIMYPNGMMRAFDNMLETRRK
jgi:NAD-dependent DNA ligase